MTFIEAGWKLQKRIEKRLQMLKLCLPDNDTLFWRRKDFALFFLSFTLFFGMGVGIFFINVYYYSNDWWLVPVGISEVFLFLFIICEKVDRDDEE
ncbi:unnamed protein product [marine sediment metagenome]|uniref:Uncharacterized protein n=1 Tax=marine sediment metagenome TaxID=412755 RepID=X0XRG6_9ZZZZ